MKRILLSLIVLSAVFFNSTKTLAQSSESRTKIQMVINFQGKTVTTDLNSLSSSLARYYDDVPNFKSQKDSTKIIEPMRKDDSFYLSMEVKKISDDLIRIFAKKTNQFDGSITITDTYGKNPPRIFRFKQASLYSLADQFSEVSYSDSYSSSSLAILCKQISINGIEIEQ